MVKRVVISWRRDGLAVTRNRQVKKVNHSEYRKYMIGSPVMAITGISQYGSPGKLSVYAICVHGALQHPLLVRAGPDNSLFD